jgi:RNA polymerase sigma-70 factor, ECF subfamily
LERYWTVPPEAAVLDADRFQRQRPLLFALAYRMLGSATEADDVLQDAWLRWNRAEPSAVRSDTAYATTIVTRLCLDRLKSARATRERYIGPWLPEPLLTDPAEPPDVRVQRAESITLAFLVLLETLSPEERAVFLLKEVFEYDHAEIARMLGLTPANSRQIFHRAKARVAARRPRPAPDASGRRAVAERFARAFSAGDAEALNRLLAEDVGFWSDGGGKAFAARRPLAGRPMVVKFLAGLHRSAARARAMPVVTRSMVDVNAEPALLVRLGDRLDSVFVLTIDGGAVSAIRVIRNPDKLAYLTRQLNVDD